MGDSDLGGGSYVRSPSVLRSINDSGSSSNSLDLVLPVHSGTLGDEFLPLAVVTGNSQQ